MRALRHLRLAPPARPWRGIALAAALASSSCGGGRSLDRDAAPEASPWVGARCEAIVDCAACDATPGCGFCRASGACASLSSEATCAGGFALDPAGCGATEPPVADCADHADCTSCAEDSRCGWCAETRRCEDVAARAQCPAGWQSVSSQCLGDDSHAAEWAACAFSAGTLADWTLDAAQLSKARARVRHVFVLIEENHSFDNLFGATAVTRDVDGFPDGFDAQGFSWPMRFVQSGVAPFAMTDPCPVDPPHQWDDMHAMWNFGAMDGFVRAAGAPAMGYYTDASHPFYTALLRRFASSDRFFGAVLGGTWANRPYVYCGGSYGWRSTGQPPDHVDCRAQMNNSSPMTPPAGTLFEAMSMARRADGTPATWEYAVEHVTPGNPWDYMEATLGWSASTPGVVEFASVLDQLAGQGALPDVVFLDAGEGYDEHPANPVARGEQFVARVVDAVMASRYWNDSVLFVTYDESGGYFDHVPPPPACPPTLDDAAFDRLGFRVPLFAVSPFARPGHVSHLVHSHASILRFVEAVFQLPALTRRDANADALLDLFDFDNAPAAGTVFDPSERPASDPGCP